MLRNIRNGKRETIIVLHTIYFISRYLFLFYSLNINKYYNTFPIVKQRLIFI